jgi:hypothetical protein
MQDEVLRSAFVRWIQELDMHQLLAICTHPCWATVVIPTVQVLILRAVLPLSVLPTAASGGLAGTAQKAYICCHGGWCCSQLHPSKSC